MAPALARSRPFLPEDFLPGIRGVMIHILSPDLPTIQVTIFKFHGMAMFVFFLIQKAEDV